MHFNWSLIAAYGNFLLTVQEVRKEIEIFLTAGVYFCRWLVPEVILIHCLHMLFVCLLGLFCTVALNMSLFTFVPRYFC